MEDDNARTLNLALMLGHAIHAWGEVEFVHNSLLILKYSNKLMVVMTNCENDSIWLNENLPEFACTLSYYKLEQEVGAEVADVNVPE